MNVVRYPTDRLVSLLRDQKVATMSQLKSALGTAVTFTVLRKLSSLGYRSSYSHGGTYYTLESIAQYDERGLWSCRDIHFSRHGTLLNTAATLVTNAPAGYFTNELEAVVHVATKDALRQLVERGRLHRQELGGAIFIAPPSAGGARRSGPHARRSSNPRMIYRPLGSCFIVCWTNSNGDSTPVWKA